MGVPSHPLKLAIATWLSPGMLVKLNWFRLRLFSDKAPSRSLLAIADQGWIASVSSFQSSPIVEATAVTVFCPHPITATASCTVASAFWHSNPRSIALNMREVKFIALAPACPIELSSLAALASFFSCLPSLSTDFCLARSNWLVCRRQPDDRPQLLFPGKILDLPCHDSDRGQAMSVKFVPSKLFKRPLMLR